MQILTPLLIPLVASLLMMLLRRQLHNAIALASGLLLLLGVSALLWRVADQGELSLALGAWPLPYAIEFRADGLSALLMLLVALVGLAVQLFQIDWLEQRQPAAWQPLQQGLLASTMAVLLAADLFNLYVWFELMLIAVLGLLVAGNGKRHLEAAMKYFALSMLGTLLMLAAIGLIYGSTGHLNFGALAEVGSSDDGDASHNLFVGLLLIALFVKAGVFPLYAWLPAAYHTLPVPLLALVGGVLTKITLYVILRLSGQVFDLSFALDALGWLALITMLSGALGAAFHWDLRRILAFHIVSQIGYLLLGVALSSAPASTATGFFLAHNMLVKANLILIAGLMWAAIGHYDLRRGGGLYPARPWLAAFFLISAFSLVGVLSSSGFWGKFMLLQEAFNQQHYLWGGGALASGILTLYSMVKIWLEGFWKAAPQANPPTGTSANGTQPVALRPTAMAAVALLSLSIVALGLSPEPLIAYLQQHNIYNGAP